MSRKDKLVKRLLSRPKDFTYDELVTILKVFGYVEVKSGQTAGSRRAFISEVNSHIIRLHKPHPDNVLRIYQIDIIISELRKGKLI
jgi:hypothetical protein